jgi:hypothetical protein
VRSQPGQLAAVKSWLVPGAFLQDHWSIAAPAVLIIEQDDTPEQVAYISDGLLPEFKKTCPACKTKVIAMSTDQLQNLPTQVETALVADPPIDYVASEFDANVSTGMAPVTGDNAPWRAFDAGQAPSHRDQC